MIHSDLSERSIQPSKLVGINLPGSGRLRLCRAFTDGLAQGDWVAIESAYGVEGGQVTVAPELLLGTTSAEPYGRITRRLYEPEIRQVAELSDEARVLLHSLVSTVGLQGDESLLAGLRFTLQPKRAIISRYGDTIDPAFEERLRQSLDTPYAFEHEGADDRIGHLYGGLGRLLPAAANLETIIHQRFEPAGSSDLPAGYPRLLSKVSTPKGIGVVVSVSTKHRQARVKLADDGTEIQVPLDELRVLDWNR